MTSTPDQRIASIDIGNTRVHCGLVVGHAVHNEAHFNTKDFQAGLTDWLSHQCASGTVYCSVVPDKLPVLETLLQGQNVPSLHLNYQNAPDLGLPISYARPPEIGQDRLANAIAAQAVSGGAAIVLDAGTAVTFDLICPQAGYIGGLIAPGLGVLTDYLHEKTAQLPKVALKDIHPNHSFGESTEKSMAIACAVGFSGMIRAMTERALQEMQKHGQSKPAMLATGGSIEHLLDAADHWETVPNLTLLGLAEAFRRHHA